MKRREFLRKAAVGVTGSAAALTLGACTTGVPTASQASPQAGASQPAGSQAPGQLTSLPTLEWRMATSWPTSLDTIFGGAQTVADRVSAMTNGKFRIRPYAAGELVPGLQVLDAVQAGTVEMGHTAAYYYVGKSPVFAFGTSLPFGLNAQQQNAWLYHGGGLQQLQEFYKQFNIIAFPAGNTGVQMGGWFKNEIASLSALRGLKMRIPGLGGQVMTKLGVVTQAIAAPEIYQALETGAIDATEWVGPYDDEKLGFNKIAQYYYYPGWWEPGPTLDIQINLSKWNELPVEYQEILKTAAYEANVNMLASYDAKNREALARLVQGGTQLTPYSEEIMAAAEAASFELYDEFSASDPTFKAIFEPWRAFRDSVYAWNKINEVGFTSYVYKNVE